nr:hypothetical protein [Halomicronema hongdechloris]
MSQKYSLYAESPQRLTAKGMNRLSALMLVANCSTVLLEGEWLEAFWCPQCQRSSWYHVEKIGARGYRVQLAPQALWRQATGVVHPRGNPSVGDFTRRQARAGGEIRDFRWAQ